MFFSVILRSLSSLRREKRRRVRRTMRRRMRTRRTGPRGGRKREGGLTCRW